MNATLESAHLAISQLVREFKQNEKHYLSASYVEASLRADFLDKFWKALGWDVSHDAQTNPAEQEVKIERNVQVAMAQKRADYAFFLAPNYRDVRFFVEAKKPSVDLDRSADAHFQTLRYGWNANTPLAVLTDFEQVFVLDCRAKPDIKTAIQRTHKKFHYTQFLDRETFAEFYWLFSREALASGALDRAIAALPKPSGKAKQMGLLAGAFKPVDESFLDDLEQYRETLAKAFKRDNPDLDGFTLTEVTQRVLDRLVFLRFLEDKLIETDIRVSDIARAGDAWAEFVAESKRLDGRYNGGVYRAHPLIDTGKLKMGGDEFRDVCEELGNAHSPYNFNVIPIHILGSIYERFLGKVVTATDKRAKIEEKPEVRKAGGVYYTPEYIVRYIVDGTVGKLIEGKTPAEIARLRFADIACGSGSFALTVFDTLLAHHTHWYNDHPDRAEKDGCAQNEDGAWRLTLSQRRKILLNNVYGVDIDRQAVEVTQVSLYLKLLEEETTASAHQFELQLHDTLLPSLTKNIVCGNSLIGTDILTGQMFAREEERALNPMDFEDAFPEVMRAGGFDAIVGNPPYGAELDSSARRYVAKNFNLGTTDTAALMLAQALRLAKSKSLIGLIVPKPLTYSSTWKNTRDLLIDRLCKLVDVGKVWKEVKLEQVICFFADKSNSYLSLLRQEEIFLQIGQIEKEHCAKFEFWVNRLSKEEVEVGIKILSGQPLGDFASNTRGGMFQNEVKDFGNGYRVIGGKQIERFFLRGTKGILEDALGLSSNAYVKPNSILVQNIVAHIENPIDHIKIIGAIVEESEANRIVILDTVNQLTPSTKLSGKYLLALLHSNLINWYTYRFVYAKAIRTMHFDATSTNRIPIRPINFDDPADTARHDKMVSLVDAMLDAKKKLAAAQNEAETDYYTRRCDSLDRQIDTLVYELYGLTHDEIAIVEGRAET